LAANAIDHGDAGLVSVALTEGPNELTIVVSNPLSAVQDDIGPPSSVSTDHARGRGLFLVNAVSTELSLLQVGTRLHATATLASDHRQTSHLSTALGL